MNEFVFEQEFSPWEHALSGIQPGDSITAYRFLELISMEEDLDAEQAIADLERRNIFLDISGLVYAPSGRDAERLELEQRCYLAGTLKQNLEGNDPLLLTLKQLERIAPLEHEDHLAQRAASGEERAMEVLTNGYLPYVYTLAGEFLGKGVLLLDLIQEGSLGLWESVLRYEGGSFRAHAQEHIRRGMTRAVVLQAYAGGVCDRMRASMERYRAADRELLTQLGRNPLDEEIAQYMGVTLEETKAIGKMLREAQTMEKVRAASKPPQQSPEDEQAVEDTAYFQSRRKVEELLSALDERSASVVSMRFGLDGKPPKTAADIADAMGLSEDQVNQIEIAAMLKLRQGSQKEG